MTPTSCGSDRPGLVFCSCFFVVLFKNRMEYRKQIALKSSYQLIWESRQLPLKMLVSCILGFKRMLSISSFERPSRGSVTHRSSLGFPFWSLVRRAIKISPAPHPLQARVPALTLLVPPGPLSSLKAVSCSPRGTTTWCHLEELAGSRRSLVKDDACVASSAVTWPVRSLSRTSLPPRMKCWQRFQNLVLKRKCWFEDKGRGVFSLLEGRSLKLFNVWVCPLSLKSLTVSCLVVYPPSWVPSGKCKR